MDDPEAFIAWEILLTRRPDQAEHIRNLIKQLARAAMVLPLVI